MDTGEQVRTALEKIAAEIKATYGTAADYGLTPQNKGAMFFVKLDMIRDLAAHGLDVGGRAAGNTLQMILEELPSLYRYAEAAGLKADFGGSAVHIKLDMIGGYADKGIGDETYNEMFTDFRP